MGHSTKISFLCLLLASYGCSPASELPLMLHTATGMTPLSAGEDPVLSIKGTPLKADLEGLLSLEGVLAPLKAHTGSSVEITLIWRVQNPKGLQKFKVFVHGQTQNAERHQIGADHPLRFNQPKAHNIQKGDYIEDTFTLNVPSFFVGESLVVYAGLYTGKKRYQVTPKEKHDGKNRIEIATIALDGAHPSLPQAQIPRTAEPITIDGQLTEPFWETAAQLSPFILYHGKKKAQQQTRVKAAWSPQFLYLAFQCDDKDIHTPYLKRDDPIYESEAVEIFIDADGDQDDYIELQNAPNNVQFDANFKGGRRKNFNIAYNNGYQTKVTIDGTLNNDQDIDKGWISEWKIPVAEINDAGGIIKAGDKWRVNLFRLDRLRRAGKVKGSEASAWSSPLSGDFHNIARMGTFIFVEK
jgi:hypothetical protein